MGGSAALGTKEHRVLDHGTDLRKKRAYTYCLFFSVDQPRNARNAILTSVD